MPSISIFFSIFNGQCVSICALENFPRGETWTDGLLKPFGRDWLCVCVGVQMGVWTFVLTTNLYMSRCSVCELCKDFNMLTTEVWYYYSSSAGFTQLYKCKLLQYVCCSINCLVPMAALREEVEACTSQLMSGNLPAGLGWPSELPEWKQSLVFLEVIEEL